MARDLRKDLGIRERPARRTGLTIIVVAVVVALTGVVAVLLAPSPGPSSPEAVGLTDRSAYRSVATGLTQAQVQRVLGAPPRRIQATPLQPDAPECWIYDRRSGRAGGYEFCFRGGHLDTKSRRPAAAGGPDQAPDAGA